jgi:hypothetical protein
MVLTRTVGPQARRRGHLVADGIALDGGPDGGGQTSAVVGNRHGVGVAPQPALQQQIQQRLDDQFQGVRS